MKSISVGASLGVGTYQVNATATNEGSTIVTTFVVTANFACKSPAERAVPSWISLFSMLWDLCAEM